MRVFLTKWMSRYVRREGIDRADLWDAVLRAERGLLAADLGGGLIKQRVARRGKGRSSGYRTLLAYRRADRAVFIFGFAKSERANIEQSELKTAREVAAKLLVMSPKKLELACTEGEIEEVFDGNAKNKQAN